MCLLVAETENSSSGKTVRRCLTMVVLPAPDGAETTITLSCDAFKRICVSVIYLLN
jgi:hypothetical protein